jgi:hypothetical protein
LDQISEGSGDEGGQRVEDDPDFDDRVEEELYGSESEVMDQYPVLTGQEYSHRENS